MCTFRCYVTTPQITGALVKVNESLNQTNGWQVGWMDGRIIGYRYGRTTCFNDRDRKGALNLLRAEAVMLNFGCCVFVKGTYPRASSQGSVQDALVRDVASAALAH